jgi:hypothetical protein
MFATIPSAKFDDAKWSDDMHDAKEVGIYVARAKAHVKSAPYSSSCRYD